MANQQLVDYIRQSISNGVSEKEITQSLINNGWSKEQIDAGFYSIGSQLVAPVFKSANNVVVKVFLIVAAIVILGVVIVIFAIGLYSFNSNKQTKLETVNADINPNLEEDALNINTVATATPELTTTITGGSQPNQVETPTKAASIDYLWSLFDQLNIALKNGDSAAYNKISYTPVSPEMASQFAKFASFLYGENIKLNKADFVNKWQDDKQAIFTTNPVREDTASSYGFKQSKISFIKDGDNWKILSISPQSIGYSVLKSDGPQGLKDLQVKLLDSDKDGLTDNDETCSGWQASNPNCIKTDPNKRDTNSNGWWDGIEKDMKLK